MALIAYDGFDHYATAVTDLENRRAGGFQWNSQSINGYVVPGRNSFGMAIGLGQNAYLQGALTTAIPSGYVGFGFRTVLTNFDANPSVRFMDLHAGGSSPNVIQTYITFNVTSGSISAYRGDNTLLASTGNNVFSNNTWNHIEIFVTISNASGVVQVRVNNVLVLNQSGLDTQNTANAWFEGIWFDGPPGGSGTTLQIDDFFVANTTAGSGLAPFNTFTGDCRVYTLWANGDAITQQWTPLAAPNWQQISEVRNDGDTTYNSTTTVGALDSFNFQDIPTTFEVLAVQVTGSYRRDDAGTRTISQQLSSGGTTVTGANYVLPSTYVYACDFWTTDPHTSAAWTVAAVNAAAAGYTLVA